MKNRYQHAALVLLVMEGLGGCRTRPWELDSTGGAQPTGNVPSDFGLDLAPDLTLSDLSVLPDLLPPPDLTPPHYCDGIFVFDLDQRLSFFDPQKLLFTDIARLSCPGTRGATPYSMAVARDGIAWVEFNDGQLFRVDTTTGFCAATQFVTGQQGFTTFGMGFAANSPGSPDETLFIAGAGQQDLGTLDLQTLTITTVGTLPGDAGLTGTADGELWGFFSSPAPSVGRIDKATAGVNPFTPLPQLGDMTINGYAFGFFAGEFNIFTYRGGGSTNINRFDPVTQTVTRVLSNTGRHIVGAGVSTCAPGK